MYVDVSNIVAAKGAETNIALDFVLDADMPAKVRLTANIKNLGDFYLQGNMTAEYKDICSLCLEPVDVVLACDVSQRYVAAQNGEQQDLKPEDDFLFFDGKSIDVSELAQINILLEAPMKHLCSQDCKGLCIKCGANLNQVECGCVDESFNPEFEKLVALFK